jgi:hypothetical protein
MQTTVNDIASLFMGNPGALQNRIQKEQQAKPGIPPDLKELLALQQIQEQLQASQQQQALQNPQNQPTVAQSLQQAAKQALMARQVQAQQQQMAQAGQMGLPQGLPQPQRQPEMGLDQIQSNLGEYYGGGIVAFNGEGTSLVSEEKLSEEGKKWLEESRRGRAAEAPKSTAGSSYKDLPKTAGQSGLSTLIRNLAPVLSSPTALSTLLGGAALTGGATNALSNATPEMREQLMGDVGSDTSLAAAILNAAKPSNKPSEPEQVKDLAPAKTEAAPPLPEKKPAEKLTPSKPRPPGLPGSPRLQTPAQTTELAGPPIEAMNKPMSKYEEAMAKIADMDPAEIERQRREQYDKEIGKPQFAEERELIKELQARRANIGKGTNPLMDLLEGIATSAPGRGGILSQGAEGVRNARAMQQQREQQNMDMLKEILGQQKTITSGERAYKENLFALGKKVYDETFAQRFEALKAQGMDEREARRIASEEARAKERLIFDREQLTSQERRHRETIAAGSQPSGDFLAFKNDPETYKKYMEARTPNLENRGQLTRKDAEKIVTDRLEGGMAGVQMMRDTQELLKKQGNPNPTTNDVFNHLVQEMMKGSPYAPKDGAVNPGTSSPGNRAPLSSFNIPQR